MKGYLFAAATVASLAFAGSAFAGELTDKCKANAEAEGGDVAQAETVCSCIEGNAGDDATLLAELMAIANEPTQDARNAAVDSASESAKAAITPCLPEAPAE